MPCNGAGRIDGQSLRESIQSVARGEKMAETIATLQEKNSVSKDYSNVPTYKQVAEEAGLPEKVDAESLIGKPIVIEEWEPGSARIPTTGETSQGFWVVCTIVESDDRVTFFCGQTVLVKALKALSGPFRTTIVRDGTAYEFR
jgi:hypothetical protein